MKSLILGAAALALLGACGGGNDPAPAGQMNESAYRAAARQFDEIAKGQWGREWDELIPVQQALVAREDYITCGQRTLIDVSNLRQVEVYPETIGVPGTTLQMPSTAVTVALRINAGGKSADTHITVHEIAIEGRWKWILSDPASFENGKCP